MPKRPQKPIRLLPIPLTIRPASAYGSVFDQEGTAAVFAKAGVLLLAETELVDVARRLDTIAFDFILASEALDTATPGELSQWAREVEKRAHELLACFTRAVDFGDPLDAADRVLRGPTGMDETGRLLDVRSDLAQAVTHLRGLAHRAGCAADAYDQTKGQPRQPPRLELGFYKALAELYVSATGRPWGASTTVRDSGADRTGPCVRFCLAVAKHLSDRMASFGGGSEIIRAALQRMQSPGPAADRIRDTKSNKGGPVRKR